MVLPSAPQTKPLLVPPGANYPGAPEEDVLGYETDAGLVREYKSTAERMNKKQREKAGYNRITAYSLAEGIKMKLLIGFLKREHNVQPRVFDEAIYVVSVPSSRLHRRVNLSRYDAVLRCTVCHSCRVIHHRRLFVPRARSPRRTSVAFQKQKRTATKDRTLPALAHGRAKKFQGGRMTAMSQRAGRAVM